MTDEARADREAIDEALTPARSIAAPAPDAKFQTRAPSAIGTLRWEQHTEFTTYTWSTSLDAAAPFAHPDPCRQRARYAFRPPGASIVAAHLCVVGRERRSSNW